MWSTLCSSSFFVWVCVLSKVKEFCINTYSELLLIGMLNMELMTNESGIL